VRVEALAQLSIYRRDRSAAFGRNQKVKIGSCESGELFFASAFLFAAWPSYEGGEKRTTAKNSEPNIRYWC